MPRISQGTKIAILSLATAITLSACIHKKTDYACICTSRATGIPDSSFSLGEISHNDAYSQCKVHNNAVDSCDMLLIN